RRRQPLCGRRPGRPARRPPGRPARGRRPGSLVRRRRRDDRVARGLPRPPSRPTRPRRELRRAGGGRVRRARPATHARAPGARGGGRAARRRLRADRGHRRRLVGGPASFRGSRRRRSRGRRRSGASGRDPARRRPRIRVVPLAGPARARPQGAHPTPGERMKLTVNGRAHEVESAPLTPLLAVLREELTITSPKAGCQQGGCGACTVLVDGKPVRSCLLPVAAVDGSEVTTLEGLGTPERLAPVQAAFYEQYGSQCGFCTPGVLMATHALLERTPRPSRDEIEQALAGHVCRCTGYVKILASVEAAANGSAS